MSKSYSSRRIASLAAAAALTAGCARQDIVARAATEQAARAVAVAHVKRHELVRSLELAAEFRPYQEIDLHAKVSGYLKAIHVDVGDRVQKGQAIAELEAPEMMQELAHAEATLKRTQRDVQRAQG